MRTSTIFALLSLVAASHAVIKDPRKNLPYAPESSQAVRAQQQSLQKVETTRVTAPAEDKYHVVVPIAPGDPTAASAIASVATLAENTAARQSKTPEPTSPPWKGPLGALALGGGAFMAFWVFTKKQER